MIPYFDIFPENFTVRPTWTHQFSGARNQHICFSTDGAAILINTSRTADVAVPAVKCILAQDGYCSLAGVKMLERR